jgi:hypothetical protein
VVRAGIPLPLFLQHAARKGAYRRPRTRLRHPSGVGGRGEGEPQEQSPRRERRQEVLGSLCGHSALFGVRLPQEKRHRVYKIVRLVVRLAPNGDLEISGDLIPEPLRKRETRQVSGLTRRPVSRRSGDAVSVA